MISLQERDPKREATIRASLFPAGKQRLVRFFLRNAFACSDLTVGLVNSPKQLQCLNEPVIFGRVQHHGGAPSMLRQHQRSFVRLNLLDQFGGVRSKCRHRLNIMLHAQTFQFRTSFRTSERTTYHAHACAVSRANLSIILLNSSSTLALKSDWI